MNVMQTGQVRRRTRSPIHDFHLRHRAYVIQPFMYHPVRPGETLKSLLWQSRVVTDPIANPLMGWHIEYYFFYVQLQDCASPGTEDAFMSPLWDTSQTFSNATRFGPVATRLENYTSYNAAAQGADFTYRVYQRIVEEYFRDENETWNTAHKMSGSLALARRNRRDVFDSLGNTISTDAPVLTVGADDTFTAQEIANLMDQYAMQVSTNTGAVKSFEDYLASQGQGRFSDVKKAYRPELVRYIKEWSYPVNTVEPTTGVPTSAVSWAISARGDKDRFFKEPGFLVGVTLARPKTLVPFPHDLVSGMNNGSQWIPKQYLDNPSAGIYNFGTGNPSVDMRDLFEYGAQFVNFDVAGTYKANLVNWVTAAGAVDNNAGVYPVESSLNSAVWASPTSNNVRQDGRVDLAILSDLPGDLRLGTDVDSATGPTVAAVPQTTLEVAEEWLRKYREQRAGNRKAQLPNVRSLVESGVIVP